MTEDIERLKRSVEAGTAKLIALEGKLNALIWLHAESAYKSSLRPDPEAVRRGLEFVSALSKNRAQRGA